MQHRYLVDHSVGGAHAYCGGDDVKLCASEGARCLKLHLGAAALALDRRPGKGLQGRVLASKRQKSTQSI